MRTEIRRERTVELFMEGFRFNDIKRWGTAEIEMSKSLLGVEYTATEWELSNPTHPPLNNDGFIETESATKRQFLDKHYLFPIPSKQIFLNPSLTQNPGW